MLTSFNAKQCHSKIQWSQFPSETIIRQLIQNQLDIVLPSVYGYCLVSLGELADDLTFEKASVVNVVRLNAAYDNAAWVLPEQLPLSSDDVDAIVLPFELEQSLDPHSLLRESYRALRPGGKLIIVMFNPISLWGFRKVVSAFDKNKLWKLPFYRVGRVMDWLSVLDFKVTISHNLFNPWRIKSLYKQESYTSSSAYSRMGTITCMVAEKRLAPMTLKPQWQRLKPAANIGLESMRKTLYSDTLKNSKDTGKT